VGLAENRGSDEGGVTRGVVRLTVTFGGAGDGVDEEDDDCAGTGIAGRAATGRPSTIWPATRQ
jgi:hypothetical protein